MNELVKLTETPRAETLYMIAGWQQWADAGSISSEFPGYLVERTGARKIGEIKPDGFYLFQVPGTHHFLRPEIKLEQGYRVQMRTHKNEIYYVDYQNTGLVIFLGDEPHVNVDGYADAFLSMVKELGVKRVIAVGGVYAPVPYAKAREVSSIFSLPELKDELAKYAVKFSDYEGGATIGTYMAHVAERWGIEMMVFYAMVPAYDFAPGAEEHEGMRIENDYKAWYELGQRINRMFGLWIDLSHLEQQSEDMIATMDDEVEKLIRTSPQLKVKEYIAAVEQDFVETPFTLLDELWERELGDLFGDDED